MSIPVPSETLPALNFSIYELREVNLDNFVLGDILDETSTDQSGSYISSLSKAIVEKYRKRGLRPLDSFRSLIPIDVFKDKENLLVALAAQSTSMSATVESVHRVEDNVSFARSKYILNEVQFDCDSPISSSLDDVPCLAFKESPQMPKYEDLVFHNNSYIIKDADNDGMITVNITDGANIRHYNILTYNKWAKIDSDLADITITYKNYQTETGTLAETTDMANLVTSIYQSLLATDWRSGVGGEGEIKDGVEVNKTSFSFESSSAVPIADVKAMRQAFGSQSYGVLIYETTATPTQSVDSNTGSITIADFSECFAYGYVNLKDYDWETGVAKFSCTFVKLPNKNKHMEFVKLNQAMNNPDFDKDSHLDSSPSDISYSGFSSGAQWWYYPHGDSNTPEKYLRFVLESNAALPRITIGTLGSGITQFNTGNRIYVDFEIKFSNWSPDDAGECRLRISDSGGAMADMDILLTGEGRYSFVSEELTGDITINSTLGVYLDVDVINTPAKDFIYDITYLKMGECARSDF